MANSINDILTLIAKVESKLKALLNIRHTDIANLWKEVNNFVLLRGHLIDIVNLTIRLDPNLKYIRIEGCQYSFLDVYEILIGSEDSLLQAAEENQKMVMENKIEGWFNQMFGSALSLIYLIQYFLAHTFAPWLLTRTAFASLYFSLIDYANILAGIANNNENLADRLARDGRKKIFDLVPDGMKGIFDRDYYFNKDVEWVLMVTHKYQVEQALSQNIDVPLEVIQAYPEFVVLSRHRKIAKEHIQLIDRLIESTIIKNFKNIELDSIINFKMDFQRLRNSFNSVFSHINKNLIIEQNDGVVLFKEALKIPANVDEIIYIIPFTNKYVEQPWYNFFEFEIGINRTVRNVGQIAILCQDKNFEYEKEYQRYVVLQKGRISQK